MSSYSEQELDQALRQCEAEPIHQIGQIQPHGALLVLSSDSQHLLLQASDNMENFFDLPADGSYGKPLSTLMGEIAAIQIEQMIQDIKDEHAVTGLLSVVKNHKTQELHARLFVSDEMFVLELVHTTDKHQTERLAELQVLMQKGLSSSESDVDIYRYFEHVASLVQGLTGFDRVMVYRFDPNWDGEVIAESRVESAASYLGLHFPASDIPPQARRLYTCNLVRQVADIEAKPISILPALNPVSKAPLDMTYSTLRSFSPMHIEYLKNMGVQASMSISLLQNGRLWGLIACHHLTPKQVSNPLHEAAAFISRMASVKLSSIEALEQRNLVNKAIYIVGELLKYITAHSEESILLRLLPDLQDLPDATGILMLVEGKLYVHGEVPDPEAINSLIAWVGSQPKTEVFSCDHLAQQFSPASAYQDIAAGLLATPLSSDMRNCIVWLRKEKLRTVHWAGNSEKILHQDSDFNLRLSPRTSFDTWAELWRGRCAPWSHIENAITSMLSVVVTEGLSQKSLLDQALEKHKKTDAELRIAATAFESQEGIILADANVTILRVNRAFTHITGFSPEEVIGKNPSIFQSSHHDADFFAAMWECIYDNGVWEGEIWNKRKDSNVYPAHITITAVKDEDGSVKNYVYTIIDITLSKAAADEIKRLAYYDPLTDLPNRRLLVDRLKQALASSARNSQKGALLFIDMDNFKTLNDTLGHDMGDLLLQQVAERLISCVRECDTVARLGGDEFVVMLEDLGKQAINGARRTEIIGTKILASLNQPYRLSTHDYHSTPSIGATLFTGHQQSVEELLKQADIAMYQAKTSGRNALRFFDPQMQAGINSRVELEADLRLALADNQFELYYQPQVYQNCEIIGAEVLLRWQHPTRGLVSPNDFIPLAEETGLILPIGQWVLETASAQIKIWEANPKTQHLHLAVNVSARQFHQCDFVEQVIQILGRHTINAGKLKLELTETLVIKDITDTIVKMQELKAIGVRFAMDDFGTGYSSLSYLTQLPLFQLKIDKSFVHNINVKHTDGVIVQTIIGMANNLSMEVIAEGVETEAQRVFLEVHGCPLCQGFLFSKPVPLAAFEALFN